MINSMRIFIPTLFIIFFLINNAYAEKIEKFLIIGNVRIADETIVLFSKKKLIKMLTKMT